MPPSNEPAVIIDLRDGVQRTPNNDGRVLTLLEAPPETDVPISPTNTVVLNWRRPAATTEHKPVYDRVKRMIDVVAGSLALVAALPAIAAGAAAVKLSSPGPAFFKQERVGRNGETFKILKLRSMYIDADHRQQQAFNEAELKGQLGELEDFQLESDPRITRIGAILRKTSIDELPQLFNVVSGDMSLVGPRPSCQYEVELYQPRFQQRHDVLPGITGLWQVEGRRTIDMIGMLELDVDYVQRRSTWLDLKILARTLPAVLSGTGAG